MNPPMCAARGAAVRPAPPTAARAAPHALHLGPPGRSRRALRLPSRRTVLPSRHHGRWSLHRACLRLGALHPYELLLLPPPSPCAVQSRRTFRPAHPSTAGLASQPEMAVRPIGLPAAQAPGIGRAAAVVAWLPTEAAGASPDKAGQRAHACMGRHAGLPPPTPLTTHPTKPHTLPNHT
jgi:hypothetical protein